MPWVPTNDFEEEVVNLQPHHDFIYGALSEPEFSYPRPKEHVEYAANKKIRNKEEQQKECDTTSQINAKLRTIKQVQLMAGTKPIGEQPSLDDWENNENIEQETIGMMRYCGIGVSVEQPLDQKVTIASYPVDNKIKVVKNGRRKVALFFDENVFKFQEKLSDTSSDFQNCKNSNPNNISKNDSLASRTESDTSFDTSSSLSLNSFSTIERSDFFSPGTPCKKTPLIYTKEQRLREYEKLMEDTALLSLDSSKNHSFNSTRSCDRSSVSFKTAENNSSWKPVFEDEDIFNKKENWPKLFKEGTASDVNTSDYDDVLNSTQNDSTDEISSEASGCNYNRKISFLDRFIESADDDKLNATENSTSTKPLKESKTTYATIAKESKLETKSSSKQKEKKDTTDLKLHFPPFYTTRRMYALKRNVK